MVEYNEGPKSEGRRLGGGAIASLTGLGLLVIFMRPEHRRRSARLPGLAFHVAALARRDALGRPGRVRVVRPGRASPTPAPQGTPRRPTGLRGGSYLRTAAPPRRAGRDVRARAGQRVRPAARVATAVVPAWRLRCATEAGFDQERARDRLLGLAAALRRVHGPRARDLRPSSGTTSPSSPRRSCSTPADPADVGRAMVAFATAGRPPEEHEQIVQTLQEGAHDWAVHNFATGCEVGDMLIHRLGLGPDVREAFAFTYERWNGNGYPDGSQGRTDPARDARRAPQPRHGGDRPPLLTGEGDRGRARAPRPHVRPGARRPVRRRTGGSGSSSSTRWSRGTPCSTSNRNPTALWKAPSSTTPSRWRPTSST